MYSKLDSFDFAREKCRRGMNAFMLFRCGHGIFSILHILATVTQLLCAFLIFFVYFLVACIYLFILFYFIFLILFFSMHSAHTHSHLYLLFWLYIISSSHFFISYGIAAICAPCTYIPICETNRVDVLFLLLVVCSSFFWLVCDFLACIRELHCAAVYTVQYLHFYLMSKQTRYSVVLSKERS